MIFPWLTNCDQKVEIPDTDMLSTLSQDTFWTRVDIKSLSICSVSVTLILPQTRFELFPPIDVGGVAFIADADELPKMLGFCSQFLLR